MRCSLPDRSDMQFVGAHALGRPVDSNDSACTSLFLPNAPNEPLDVQALDVETFVEENLASFDELMGHEPRKNNSTRLCSSCKKHLDAVEAFDPGKKTCRCCLRTHRNHMRRKRRKLREVSAAPLSASGMAVVSSALEADATATARSDQLDFPGNFSVAREESLPGPGLPGFVLGESREGSDAPNDS